MRKAPGSLGLYGAAAAVLLFLGPSVFTLGSEEYPPVEFRFDQRAGTVIHADALVQESVFLNGVYLHDALIGESSISRVLAVDNSGVASLEAVFRTEERISGLPGYVEWVSSESVGFSRDSLGRMTVPPEATRPVLRNLPVFPEKSLMPGDTWTAPVEEVHVFRMGDSLAGPYRSTAPGAYEFLGMVDTGGRALARILLNYNLYLPITGIGAPLRLLSGRSEAELLWDTEEGRLVSRSEDFEFLMMMADGTVREFRGRQQVNYRYTETLDREETATRLRKDLEAFPGIQVAPADAGVRLTLRDSEGAVYFDPESAEIQPDQRRRLESLSKILEQFINRDILISGHTAHFGTAEGRYRLSVNRAAAVADLLFPEGGNGTGRLFLRGMGSDEPAGSDAENRRVEILILD